MKEANFEIGKECEIVAPLVGAWIERLYDIKGFCKCSGRSSCRSVDCIPNRTGRTFSYVVN